MQWFKRWAVGIEAFLAHFWHAFSHFLVWSNPIFTTSWQLPTNCLNVYHYWNPGGFNIKHLIFVFSLQSSNWVGSEPPKGFFQLPQGTFAALRGIHRAEGWGNNQSFTPWKKKSHGTYKQIIHFETGTWFQPLISQGCTQLCLRVQVSVNMHLWFSYHSRSSRWRSPLPKFPVAIASKGLCDKPRLMGVAGQPSTFQVV